jgi:hypothetical protein
MTNAEMTEKQNNLLSCTMSRQILRTDHIIY